MASLGINKLGPAPRLSKKGDADVPETPNNCYCSADGMHRLFGQVDVRRQVHAGQYGLRAMESSFGGDAIFSEVLAGTHSICTFFANLEDFDTPTDLFRHRPHSVSIVRDSVLAAEVMTFVRGIHKYSQPPWIFALLSSEHIPADIKDLVYIIWRFGLKPLFVFNILSVPHVSPSPDCLHVPA